MKYWRGYLVAGILAAITCALLIFGKTHSNLLDMIYPYMSKTLITSLADWSGSVSFCVWHVIILALVVATLVSVILMFLLRWNPIQWLGWVLAVVSLLSLFSTTLYGLNRYSGPLADDIRLEITEWEPGEMKEAAMYFRDQAEALIDQVKRDGKGNPKFGSFEYMANQAGEGFRVMTYEEAISAFSGSTAPAKKLDMSGNTYSKTISLTGEVMVDPDSADLVLPYIISMEMARRMSIYRAEDAKFAAFLACKANPDVNFQYSAYCMAYSMCMNALKNDSTSAAKACVKEIEADTSKQLKSDSKICLRYFGSASVGKKKTDVAGLLASWYIQLYITPLYEEEELPFDPFDPNQVDVEYQEPTPTPLETNKG